MENLIIIVVIALIIGIAIAYIVKAKKRGDKCVGCPYAKECGKNTCTCGSNQAQ